MQHLIIEVAVSSNYSSDKNSCKLFYVDDKYLRTIIRVAVDTADISAPPIYRPIFTVSAYRKYRPWSIGSIGCIGAFHLRTWKSDWSSSRGRLWALRAAPAAPRHYEPPPAAPGHYVPPPAASGHYEPLPAASGHYEPPPAWKLDFLSLRTV